MGSNITFEIDDYVFVQQDTKKHLVKVEKVSSKINQGLKQENYPYSEDDLRFDSAEVIANFGKYPRSFIHEAFYRDFTHKDFGRVLFFLKASKDVKHEVEETLSKCYKRLSAAGLTGFLPVNVEIRPQKGKVLGHYKAQKHEGDLDTICLRPSTEHPLDQTLYHESGHGIWKRLIKKRSIKAAWIRDYNQFIEVQHLTSKDLKSLLNELLSTSQTVTEFKSTLSENDQLILREILSYIKKYHRLSILDLNLLLESGDNDTVSSVWPSDTIALSKIRQNNISNYSLKNVEEYFCECLALHLAKGKLPTRTDKLLIKTIQSL